jgi:hypothetical protein
LVTETKKARGARSQKLLSPQGLKSLKHGEWASDPAGRGAGRLQARRTAAGTVSFYYRYSAPVGERVRIALGVFDPDGRDGLTLAEARKRAGALSIRYQNGDRDLRAGLAEDESERTRRRDAEQRRLDAEAARKAGTLGALLEAYAKALEADGKPSANAVSAAFIRHVKAPHPKLWAMPALDVTSEDGVSIVGPIARAGKLREAAKLRSYMRSAFSVAVRSHTDPKAAPELRKFGIRSNPFVELATIEGSSQARDRALSVTELRAYWKRIAGSPLLRFHLLTGAQRVEQLARVIVGDYDADETAVVLRDTKGRRKVARAHVIPLVPAAVDAMKEMGGGSLGEYVFTVNSGETGAAYATVRHRLEHVVAMMRKAGELEKGDFTAGDLRRTVETRLAALGVSREIRAQLQSHGLGGVQSRHYDKHDYLVEKRNALSMLHELVTGQPGKVTSIRERKKSGASR